MGVSQVAVAKMAGESGVPIRRCIRKLCWRNSYSKVMVENSAEKGITRKNFGITIVQNIRYNKITTCRGRKNIMMQGKQLETNPLSETRQSEIQAAVNVAMDKRFNKWKRTIIFWAIVFLLVLVLLVVIGVFCIADLAKTLSNLANVSNDSQVSAITVERNGLLSADYLAAVIPVLLALGGSFIAFLGMSRLKMFDERIDQTRSEMLKEVESKVKSEVALDRVEFSNQILQDIKGEREKIQGVTDDAEKNLSNQKDKCIEEIERKFSAFEQKYSWLESVIASKEVELDFHTINDAHKLVEQLRIEKPDGYINIVKRIIDRVCNAIDMSGDSDDYHNLAAELARGSMYNEACRVLKKGEQYFNKDVDIHADIIEYSTKGGLDYAAESVRALKTMNSQIWTWRCYEFICDYYRSIGDLTKANIICDDFMKAFPNDEHGYRSKAEVLRLLYPGQDGIDKSIEVLKTALMKKINCPQCANALAEQYLSIGRYSDALRAANRSVLELAQQQPHVPAAIIFYNRATIQDRMFMQGLENSLVEQGTADAAYKDYHMALGLHLESLSPIVAQQAEIRILILKDYISSDAAGCDRDNFEALLNLLQNLVPDADTGNDIIDGT